MRSCRFLAITSAVIGIAATSPLGSLALAKDVGDRPVADRSIRVNDIRQKRLSRPDPDEFVQPLSAPGQPLSVTKKKKAN